MNRCQKMNMDGGDWMTEPGLNLTESGQCPACKLKPIVYKRRGMRFCTRCAREFDINTGKQIASHSWRLVGQFEFEKR